MSDRELLELAAKAAGMRMHAGLNERRKAANEPGLAVWKDGQWIAWNPLTDDGDALRLAVKLYLSVDMCDDCDEVTVRGNHHFVLAEIVFGKSEDPAPYVRRAIVKAAAQIGGQMP